MEVIQGILGLLLVLCPLAFAVGAWWFLVRQPEPTVRWRRVWSVIALVCTTVAYFWFWISFLFVPHALTSVGQDRGLRLYNVIGKVGVIFTVFAFLLTLLAKGMPRWLASISAVGVLLMWMSIGMV